MHSCPICSGTTLRHIAKNRIYWYCSHCHQEVPDFTQFLARQEKSYSFVFRAPLLQYELKK